MFCLAFGGYRCATASKAGVHCHLKFCNAYGAFSLQYCQQPCAEPVLRIRTEWLATLFLNQVLMGA